jgi:uncharacterized protein YjeT (DUF2065 family)
MTRQASPDPVVVFDKPGLVRPAWERGMIDFLVTVAGVVMIVEGIPWFLSPPRMKRILLGFLGLPDRVLRGMGLLLMLSGLLLVYVVRG